MNYNKNRWKWKVWHCESIGESRVPNCVIERMVDIGSSMYIVYSIYYLFILHKFKNEVGCVVTILFFTVLWVVNLLLNHKI